MKLTNVGEFNTIEAYVSWKLRAYGEEEKSFSSLFKWMFSEEKNIMAEYSDGYRIRKVTYGECKAQTERRAAALKARLDLPQGEIVGLYMDNSLEWIQVFWSILMCGYRPLLMNMRLSDAFLEKVLEEHSVRAVVSDGKAFSVKTILASEIGEGERTDFSSWGEEVIFMSSGTSDKVKLCFYTAENFYYQVGNSVDIVKKCPEIASHYEGELKQLTLLPFYHVFGFIAVYLWFGFFARTFVFLKNLNPKTIQDTIKKHKVTHFFAVPLVWNSVYKAAMRSIRGKGEKTFKKFQKGQRLINGGGLGGKLAYGGMREVRDALFGESVQFLISGGGEISVDALEFFNGIGYHLANGYGMTEVGITSVEIDARARVRNEGSIGHTFVNTEYAIGEKGTLLIKGKNMASRIRRGGEEVKTDYSVWFDSCDLAEERGGRYFLKGRKDDLIVSVSGENLNPLMIETELHIPSAEEVCLIGDKGEPVLLLKSRSCYLEEKVQALINEANEELGRLQLQGEVRRIVVTPDDFLAAGEFKRNRRKIAARYFSGELRGIDASSAKEKAVELSDELEKRVQDIFAEVLHKESNQIDIDANFFNDLGGTSLDYFVVADEIAARFGVDVKAADGRSLNTIAEICAYIKNN